jgi:ElaB/YqjD/DUF883 family membrane-anchored ribosome-binding protein
MAYTQTQPQTGEGMLNKMRDMPQQAKERLQGTRERLNETLQDVTARLEEACSYAEQQVHARPWTAVGMSFGVGIVMGALITLAARR